MNPFSLEKSIPRGVTMLNNMANPKHIQADAGIPLTLLRHCEGIAFIRIFKAGFLVMGGNVGGGCVISKIKDENAPNGLGFRWSAPISVQVGGLGGGFIFGAEQIDSIIILNTRSAVRAMTGKGNLTFGGNASLAVGPVGRDVEAHVGVSDNKELIAAYSYSQAKGAYIGGTLEGAIMFIKSEENKRFYENALAGDAKNLIDGVVSVPEKGRMLGDELDRLLLRQGDYAAIASTLSMKQSQMRMKKPSSSRIPAEDSSQNMPSNQYYNDGPAFGQAPLPVGWEEAQSPDGKTYYYHTASGQTQWDRPVPLAKVASAPPPPPPPVRVPSKDIRTVAHDFTPEKSDAGSVLTIHAGDLVELGEVVDDHWSQATLVQPKPGQMASGLVPIAYLS